MTIPCPNCGFEVDVGLLDAAGHRLDLACPACRVRFVHDPSVVRRVPQEQDVSPIAEALGEEKDNAAPDDPSDRSDLLLSAETQDLDGRVVVTAEPIDIDLPLPPAPPEAEPMPPPRAKSVGGPPAKRSDPEKTLKSYPPRSKALRLAAFVLLSGGLGFAAWMHYKSRRAEVEIAMPPAERGAEQDSETEPYLGPSSVSVAELFEKVHEAPPTAAAPPEAEIVPTPTGIPVAETPSVILELAAKHGDFTPSSFAELRPLLVVEAERGVEDPTLDWMLSEVHAYLGGRDRKEDWIRYAYETAYRLENSRPGDLRGVRAMALAFWAANRFDKTLPLADRLLKERPSDPISHFLAGEARNAGGSTHEGVRILSDAHRRFPDSFPVAEALSRAFVESGAHAQAEPIARRLVEREPSDLAVALLYTHVLTALEKWQDLSRFGDGALKRFPGQWELMYAAGRAWRQTARFDLARKAFDGILDGPSALDSQMRARVIFERGKVEFDRGEFDEAVRNFRAADALDPDQFPLLVYWGGALFRSKNYGESADVYARALSLRPRDVETRRNRGMALLEAGDVGGAGEVFQGLHSDGVSDASVFYHLGRVRSAQGNRQEAAAFFTEALRVDPKYHNARILLDRLSRPAQ